MPQYRIYGFDTCPYCQKAKALLEQEGLTFDYVAIPTQEERTAFLDARGFVTPDRTFPRVYALAQGMYEALPPGAEEVLIGGFQDLEEHILFGVAA